MVCMYCSSKTKIINSRYQKKSNSTWRRHKCIKCSSVFTTIEQPQLDALWLIKGPRGQLIPFRRDKLLVSIYNSCKHRKTALEDASWLTATVIQKLKPEKDGVLIDKINLNETTYRVLKRFDKSAAVYYKAYHQVND